MKLFSKNRKRITAAVLSALLLCAAPLSYADDTVADMEAKQTELANKKADLENKISSLESQEADKTEYLTLLSEKIDTIKEQIDTANSDITVLNTSIKKLEKELNDSADQISDTMELLKKRLAVLYSAGCTVGTLEILFNSESLHDFSMRAEAVSTITRHDKQLIDTVAAYMNETKAQREELEKEKTALADAKKLYESSEEELKQLESDNTALLEQIRSDKSSAETELSRTEEEEYVLANMMAAKIAEMQQQMAQAKATPTQNGWEKGTVPLQNEDLTLREWYFDGEHYWVSAVNKDGSDCAGDGGYAQTTRYCRVANAELNWSPCAAPNEP